MKRAAEIAFVASNTEVAQAAKARLTARFGNARPEAADTIVALGGDGFMLQTLHASVAIDKPVYGMNCGTVGFLMNAYSEDDLLMRLAAAEEAEINPLRMRAEIGDGETIEALAINEVSLYRIGAQAAKLRVSVDGRVRMEELICDGAMVSTPAGSTAYNYSAHGPILPIGAEVLALTPVAAFRPRRWRGALLPRRAKVRFDVLEVEKRPIAAVADSREARRIMAVEIESVSEIRHRILFDPDHGLEERLIREQFT